MLQIILLYALLALTFPVAQYGLQYTQPLFLLTFRMFLAGSCLLLYWRLVLKQSFHIKKEDFFAFVKVAFFHIYLAFVPEFWALQYVSSLKTNLMYCTTPFISALLEYVLLKKQLNRYHVLGIIIVCVGMIPLLFFPGSIALDTQPYPIIFLPEMMLTIAIISATYAWFLVKDLMDKGYGLIFINGTAMLGGSLLILITLGICGSSENLVLSMKPFLLATISLILLSNIIVYNLYGSLLKKYSFTLISLAGFLSPVFGALYGKLFFGDPLSWYHAVAFAGICIGLRMFYQKDH